MNFFFRNLLLENWQRKVIAIVTALVIWLLVNHSITLTRTIPNVGIRVINVPREKTIEGLQPNGLLGKRWTLTLTGKKSILQNLSSNDIEIVVDANGKGERWTEMINKKNLSSPNPDIDIIYGISEVGPSELSVQLIQLVTEQIPIILNSPIGEAPEGYRFIDISSEPLFQAVTGPENKIQELKNKGLSLTFNLDKINRDDLDALAGSQQPFSHKEIEFFVPINWKRISNPIRTGQAEEINDPQATFLHLNFLKEEWISLDSPLPIQIFYPLKSSRSVNPASYPLEPNALVQKQHGIPYLNLSLCIRHVSPLFLDIVHSQLSIVIIASPKDNHQLEWKVQLNDPLSLEDAFVKASLSQNIDKTHDSSLTQKEEFLRGRFQKYLRSMELILPDGQPLKLVAELGQRSIILRN